ncbi:carbohydrate esterase, partial [Streptomyces sp. T-3]|nr:carbohydrate esterase [Streptomyces sp. T-3]
MRRTLSYAAVAVVTAIAAATLVAAPAHADTAFGQGLDHCTTPTTGTPLTCHFDVAPGTYDVTVELGGPAASATSVSGETRRALLPETHAGAGQTLRRAFTVDVRTPE